MDLSRLGISTSSQREIVLASKKISFEELRCCVFVGGRDKTRHKCERKSSPEKNFHKGDGKQQMLLEGPNTANGRIGGESGFRNEQRRLR